MCHGACLLLHSPKTHDDEDMALPTTHMRFGPIIKICEENMSPMKHIKLTKMSNDMTNM